MKTVAAIIVGLVFVASGALKLHDPGWPAAARALGTPRFVVPLVAPFELVLGAVLVADVGVTVAASIAAGLLVVFTVLLWRAILGGEVPACACFGALSSRPIGFGSIVRNLVLLGLAVFAAAAA